VYVDTCATAPELDQAAHGPGRASAPELDQAAPQPRELDQAAPQPGAGPGRASAPELDQAAHVHKLYELGTAVWFLLC